MSDYDVEAVDRLPFSTEEKSQRYRTDSYHGAAGLNWYLTDPTLQFTMAYYLRPDELAVLEPHLTSIGALMGGPVTRWADETDRNPPRLQRYDRWGHDVSHVVMPDSFAQSKRAVLAAQQALRTDARVAKVSSGLALFASNYLLNQADIGMGCALGTGGSMVQSLVAAYAPADVAEYVLAKFSSGEWAGETAQLLTERTGGSDLGALETTATRSGDDGRWLINGFKWFASNCAGEAFVVMAKPEGAPDSTRGIANFLVLRTRRDGSRNGVRVRQLKDKLGTRSVASGEVEFVDAEAFLLSEKPTGDTGPSDGKGLGRMMELTNAARLGIALFGLGNARRALVESLCYARQRHAFGGALIDKPLMRRKLAELIVDVEAAQAMVFDGTGAANHRQPRSMRQRIAVPVTKLKVCRLGITAASDAIEIHGGNGYIETWPVARLLRDAQVNTIWEGPDNILCLDVRRGIEQNQAHETLLARLHDAVSVSDDDETTPLVARRIEDLDAAITAWTKLDSTVAEARLFPLAQFMGDVYAGALLIEQAAWERDTRGGERKALVAALYAQRYLADRGPLRGIDADSEMALDRFEELLDGTLRL
ncbi:acyl-CoA dehydrogenase family protein [Mycobacterium montefiorense]|uniref:DNA alkylation response protein n=1 Tax=Mycobacterium montefiorense TaxID=154654 RepID=A0AA37UWF4_9MYCO|nr:acyl-CoA dehydrogenase family protein [Mycobacterium montefiorense]GBG40873.1 DNA alkylation response protein [Mycobacterium montefiorense]GKU33488.1 DNA alkylation response protein [Mycobacterium montefiorense]GKU39983.1 DNA alkylation response protein [Mycobacterium montefiorense]GKU45319.1 DNA alkylation response protein [Mycobacterium montefiorense]GKU49378.1 DNA alkylation response protein [Mycobacterium montefiorense]